MGKIQFVKQLKSINLSKKPILPIIKAMMITLYKTGNNNEICYYTIHDRQALLTAEYSITISWYTGNSKPREKVYGFDSLSERDKKIKAVFRGKIREGYSLLYSYLKKQETIEDWLDRAKESYL